MRFSSPVHRLPDRIQAVTHGVVDEQGNVKGQTTEQAKVKELRRNYPAVRI
jgi:hypothetical protein